MSTKVEQSLAILLNKGIINASGFAITKYVIDEYIKAYASLSIKSHNNFDYRLASKIACMNLVEFKKANKIPCKEGFAYIVTNPAWPNHYKVGMSKHVKKRVQTYQTYSPYRDYKLEWFGFWFDAQKGEKQLRECFDSISHEWVIGDNISKFKHLADIY